MFVPFGFHSLRDRQINPLGRSEVEIRTKIAVGFAMAGTPLFRSNIKSGVGSRQPAFLWDEAVTLAAFAEGLKVHPATYKPLWTRGVSGLDLYWTPQGVGGYAVLPGQGKDPDRYYDDNAWVAWANLEAYENNRDKGCLQRALKAYRFCISGEDDTLGGGIYWRERERQSKNACVALPAAAASYKLYKLTHAPRYLKEGDRLLRWTQKALQDADGLIMDNISVSGKVEKMKWSYNSACYVRVLLLRWKILGDDSDKSEALWVLNASIKKWIEPDTFLLDDPGMFGQHLIDAMYEAAKLFRLDEYRELADKVVSAVTTKCMSPDHLFAEKWNVRCVQATESKLLFNASVLRVVLSSELAQRH